MALDAGDGLVRALQGIGLAMLSGANGRRHKAVPAMAFQAGGMLFDKLAAMGIGMAGAALVGKTHVAGRRRIGIALGVGQFRFVALFACTVGMGRRKRKAEGCVKRRIDTPPSKRPVFIGGKVAGLAILRRRGLKTMRRFMAACAGFAFHWTEDH